MLSVVIPLRCTEENGFLLQRLGANLRFFRGQEEIECIVVDSGSDEPHRRRIRELCSAHGAEYVEDPNPGQPFAPGNTRNLGAQAARGEHLLFYDADLCADAELVPRIRRWIARAPAAHEFLMIPCLYLTERATLDVDFWGPPVDLSSFRESFLRGDNHRVAHIAVSTSTVVVATGHFLRLGGNRSEYRGHGCEDFDLLHRLASYAPLGAQPEDYYVDHKTRFVGDYRGFRAYLARYALPHLFSGLYTAHLWHPRPLRKLYFRKRQDNEALLQERMREHDRGLRAQEPLVGRVRTALTPLPRPWSTAGDSAEDFATFLEQAMDAHGLDRLDDPGIFHWRPGVVERRGTPRAKLRKLLLRPDHFIKDSRLLRRYFRG